MFISNNNITFRNNQEKNKQYENILLWMQGDLHESIDCKGYIGKKFTENSRQILVVLIRYCSLYQTNYISHDRIAQLVGIHHDTVLRTLHVFERLGIIRIISRGANKTCIYELGSFLHDTYVQWQLKDILPNLYWGIQTIIRRCKASIQSMVGHWQVAKKPDTARLLNNKIKRILYTKKTHEELEPKQEKESIYIPTQEDKQRHDSLFLEFSAILDGKVTV